MCDRTTRRAYCCAAHGRFARYEREPTRIGDRPAAQAARAASTTTLRFSISKVSTVKRARVAASADWSLLARPRSCPRGAHAIGLDAAARAAATALRIAAQGPSGPLGVATRKIRVVLPKPKPKKHCGKHQRPGAKCRVDAASEKATSLTRDR